MSFNNRHKANLYKFQTADIIYGHCSNSLEFKGNHTGKIFLIRKEYYIIKDPKDKKSQIDIYKEMYGLNVHTRKQD